MDTKLINFINTLSFDTYCIIAGVLFLMVFSRQILNLCLGLFVSLSSIFFAAFVVVLSGILIFSVAIPSAVITCYVVDRASSGKGTNSRFVDDLCKLNEKKRKEANYPKTKELY